MNPPFALKTSDEKEFSFVDSALKQMQDGGILFSILPYSTMVKSEVRMWRKHLLANNSLLSVITFPPDLFYPIGVHTLGIFVKKGIPHPEGQKVFWIRALNDGLLKKKGKRLQNSRARNDLETIRIDLRSFITNPDVRIENIPEFQKAVPIDFKDLQLELVPEAYLDQTKPSSDEIQIGIENLVRETAAFLIRARKENEILNEN